MRRFSAASAHPFVCLFCEVEGFGDDVGFASVVGCEIGVKQSLEGGLYHFLVLLFTGDERGGGGGGVRHRQ